jgi:hypothetical protein
MARPRAADDFPAIRARIEELRRPRANLSADGDERTPPGPRPCAVGSRARPDGRTGFSHLMRRALLKAR